MKITLIESPLVGGSKIQIIGKPDKGRPILFATFRSQPPLIPSEMVMRQAKIVLSNLITFYKQNPLQTKPMTLKELLIKLDACEEAREWARDMPIEEIVSTCHRGDWLLWLAKKVDVDLRLRTLAKGHCANTVRHLMTDERSIKAVDVAIAFGEGKATLEELDAAAAAAAYATAYATDAAYASAAYAAAASTAASASAANRQQTADICREYIGEALIEKVNQLLTK